MPDRSRISTRNSSNTSWQIKPGLNQLRICGPANSLVVDHASGSLIRQRNQASKSYLTYFLPPLRSAREHFRNARLNIANFVRRRLHQDSGMKELIERFYGSIRQGEPPPLPAREILLTARIMDEIFSQIYPVQERIGATPPVVRPQPSEPV